VHDVGVALDGHELGDADGAGGGDAPDVVAQEVDEHEVLGAFLGVARELAGEGEVGGLVADAGAGSGDGAGGEAATDELDEELGRAADELGVGQAEVAHVGRGVGGADGLVGERAGGGDGQLEPGGEVDLVGVAGRDVVLGPADGGGEVFGAEGGLEDRDWLAGREEGGRGRGAGLVPAPDKVERAGAGGGMGNAGRIVGATKDHGEEVAGVSVVDEGLVCLEEDGPGQRGVCGGRVDGLEAGGELVAQGGDEAALERRPAGEARGAVVSGPAIQPDEGVDGAEVGRRAGETEAQAAVGAEGPGALGGGDEDGVAAGGAALEEGGVAAGEKAFPGGGQSASREAGEVGEPRIARAESRPVGGRDLAVGLRRRRHPAG